MLKDNQFLRIHRTPLSLMFILEDHSGLLHRSFVFFVSNHRFEVSRNMAARLEVLILHMQREIEKVR